MAWLTVIVVIAGLIALVALLNAVIATGTARSSTESNESQGL